MVVLNGDSIGLSPLKRAMEAEGKFSVRLQKPDYFSKDTSIVIVKGVAATFAFTLQPAARLAMTVDPPDAEIAVDGKTIESSRLADLLLTVGPHQLQVARTGYETKWLRVVLQQGVNPAQTFSLERISEPSPPMPLIGSIRITSVPAGAAVRLNDQLVGKTPYEDNNVEIGNYQLILRKDGYKEVSKTITVRRDQTASVEANLVAVGDLYITSEPAGASIRLNSGNVGLTPKRIEQLEVGEYQVLLRKGGYKDYGSSVQVTHKKTASLNFKLTALVGSLKVAVKPFGSIYIDGRLYKEYADLPFTTNLSVGGHRLKVVHPNLGTWSRDINIELERQLGINVDFNKLFKVTITALPVWGEIFVDNVSYGSTPKQLTLRTGFHVIEVRRERYVAEAKEINLENDIREPLRFILNEK
jgi:hypothetical protein